MGNPVAKEGAVSSAMVRSRSVTAPWMFGEASSSSATTKMLSTSLSEKPERFTTTSVSAAADSLPLAATVTDPPVP